MKVLTLKEIKSPLVMEERPDLDAGPGEVVVRVKAAALNRRDYWITQGMYPGIELPVVLGSDGAGVVTQCGPDVDADWEGREVIINPGLDWGGSQAVQDEKFAILGMPRDGAFATQLRVPATQLHHRPLHLAWQEAAALPLAGVTAYRAVFSQGQLKPGERVLVTGIGGGVATMALQLALAGGADVWVTSSSEEKIGRAVELGARGGLLYTDPDWPKQLIAKDGPPDLIVDGAGGEGYQLLLKVAAPAARIVNYGATAGMPKQLDLFKVFWKQLRLQGTTMGSPDDFAALVEMTREHELHPIVDRTFDLADGNQALELMSSSPQFGKLVLKC